jgi:catechol 2,3-dioxygenase-like lactoylglutathione lyase family enzyme
MHLPGTEGERMAQSVRLGAAVVFVRDLDRSVTFYTELLGLTVADRSTTAALLVNGEGAELVLRAMGDGAQRPLGALGVQYLVWAAASQEDLGEFERRLRRCSAYRDTRTDAGVVAVEGHDPDDTPVVIVYRGPGEPAMRSLPTRIYAW